MLYRCFVSTGIMDSIVVDCISRFVYELVDQQHRRFERNKMFLPHPRVKVSIVGSLRDREVACSTSDRQGSNFESCVWRTVSSQSSHHPQEVLLAQFSLYVHKGGLKPDSFHFVYQHESRSYTGPGFPVLANNAQRSVNPLTAKLFNLNFHPLEVVSRWRDPQL